MRQPLEVNSFQIIGWAEGIRSAFFGGVIPEHPRHGKLDSFVTSLKSLWSPLWSKALQCQSYLCYPRPRSLIEIHIFFCWMVIVFHLLTSMPPQFIEIARSFFWRALHEATAAAFILKIQWEQRNLDFVIVIPVIPLIKLEASLVYVLFPGTMIHRKQKLPYPGYPAVNSRRFAAAAPRLRASWDDRRESWNHNWQATSGWVDKMLSTSSVVLPTALLVAKIVECYSASFYSKSTILL